jgi:hypothetical protein
MDVVAFSVAKGAVAEGVELIFVHSGMVAEFVKEGFTDFLSELFAGAAGGHEGLAEEDDACGEVAGVFEASEEGVTLVEAEGVLDAFVTGGRCVFDDDGDFVDPVGELGRKGGDGVFDEAVESIAWEVHGRPLNRQVVESSSRHVVVV